MKISIPTVALVVLFFVNHADAAESPKLSSPWQHQDIGAVTVAGSASEAAGVITLKGTLDIWAKSDGCYFAWQKLQGNGTIVGRVLSVELSGHSKGGLAIRESLDAGSRHATMVDTPTDGCQFLVRAETDDVTTVQRTDLNKAKMPYWLKLERQGETITGYESPDGKAWSQTGTTTLKLPESIFIGLVASSHLKETLCTVPFDNVTITKAGFAQNKSQSNQIAKVMTINIDGSDPKLVCETNGGMQAPNWSPDGKWLVCNGGNALWQIGADGSSKPEKIPTGNVNGINNDHVLSFDGKTIYFSAGAHIYAVPFAGGTPRRVSNEHPAETSFKYFLHGVSPDEKTLAYVGVSAVGDDPWGRLDLFTIPTAGGPDRRLTDTEAPDDGPEYSSDGKWIYFNSELNAKVPGHAQCYRMKPDGTSIEQLTHDDRVNWFPHISPDNKWIVYISFPPGTLKHPANKDVILRRMRPDGSEPADIIAFNGGQGTINVNSWSPDSQRIAYVTYEIARTK